MARKKATASFEESLTELTALVEKIEQGDLPLDKALQVFEQGVVLTRQCQTALAQAEQKVSILLADKDQSPTEQPFVADEKA
ncbi:exodeoxyribonuclease VII small subunit [Thiopseudomonas alkaliphila]|uniref:exodeoxyribonuclease VII small subunit n=1 Tax=Thiopseudomonas alkaliphila TaxID=1697053 RepID=UPI00069DD712|nr:exodeoxyribonuclease VII small subunit [Thiopseudomonas alkaliphila]AKX44798.1 exodeoxyribonuclease VII small subunit [Thiopseudomonas alkaliphila]AKX47618.1 exodeoxyribonuclease VII small subunit [Thiopseudomonas alkaliphila]AKX53305.1 exodeoxyribonuclease VII small subunit [Thiopseudomonas alkaliphila]